MNKLDEMDIASLSDKEVDHLTKAEKEMNSLHQGHAEEEIYLLALKR